MARRRIWKAVPVAIALAGLLSVWWVTHAVLSLGSRRGRAGSDAPVLVLSRTEHDFGTVPQGLVLQTTFPMRNLGSRRLIVIEQDRGCCGQSASPRQISLSPGESKDLVVEVDTGRWCGRVQRALGYTTNDPKLPRFVLTVAAVVEPKGRREQTRQWPGSRRDETVRQVASPRRRVTELGIRKIHRKAVPVDRTGAELEGTGKSFSLSWPLFWGIAPKWRSSHEVAC